MKKNFARHSNLPAAKIKLSHHELTPGAWLKSDRDTPFHPEKRKYPTLSQFDREPGND